MCDSRDMYLLQTPHVTCMSHIPSHPHTHMDCAVVCVRDSLTHTIALCLTHTLDHTVTHTLSQALLH